jgi:hypothetical protein
VSERVRETVWWNVVQLVCLFVQNSGFVSQPLICYFVIISNKKLIFFNDFLSVYIAKNVKLPQIVVLD